MRNVLLLLIATIVLGCSKEKPPSGRYFATFNYETPQSFAKYSYVEIINTTKEYFLITGDRRWMILFSRMGKGLQGKFPLFPDRITHITLKENGAKALLINYS